MHGVRSLVRWVAGVMLAASLAACGGGEGGDSPGTGGQSDNPPPTGGTNAAPRISGTPVASVLAGQAYDFRPSASDSDGDTLTFTAENLPEWASFDESTGRISGTPDEADIATFSGITITVSDGEASSTLCPFSIVVTDVGNGSATLSWEPPTQNVDGTPLTNLAWYEIRYGLSSSELSQSVMVNNPSLSVYVLENLTSGTWYFAVAAVNSEGGTSPLSNVASKTIS